MPQWVTSFQSKMHYYKNNECMLKKPYQPHRGILRICCMLQSTRQKNKEIQIRLIGNNSWHPDYLGNLFQHLGHGYQHRQKEVSSSHSYFCLLIINTKLNNTYLLPYIPCFVSSALLLPLTVLLVNGNSGKHGQRNLY